jgi:maleate isomerase
MDMIPRLGLIVLQADETLEGEVWNSFKHLEKTLHVTRIPSGLDVSTNSLAQMEQDLPTAAGLLPRGCVFDIVAYGCTSGTSVVGAARVHELVKSGVKTRHVTDPLTATIAWCQLHGIERLAFLSPYVEDVNEGLRRALAEAGIETPVFGSFNVAEEAAVARISDKSIIEAGIDLCESGETDALFLSCTNLRTDIARGAIRAATGRSVISSNSVLSWHIKHLLAGRE